MISILKKLDKRALLGLLVIFVIAAATQVLFVSTSKDELSQVRTALNSERKASDELKSRVEQIQRDGTQGIDVLVSRLSTMEKAIPSSIDDITLSSHVSQVATDSGVSLEQFDKSENEKATSQDILTAQSYNFTVSGDVSSVLGFVNQIQSWNQDIITFYTITLKAKSTSNASEPSSVYNSSVVLNGKVNVWYSTKPGLVSTALNAAAISEANSKS